MEINNNSSNNNNNNNKAFTILTGMEDLPGGYGILVGKSFWPLLLGILRRRWVIIRWNLRKYVRGRDLHGVKSGLCRIASIVIKGLNAGVMPPEI